MQAAVALPLLAGVGAVGGVVQGAMAFKGARGEQAQLELDKRREKTAAKERAAEIRKRMLATLGEQDAQFGARGVMTGRGGTVEQFRTVAERDGARDLSTNAANSKAKIGQIDRSISQSRMSGFSSLIGGISNAAMAGYGAMQGMESVGTVKAEPKPIGKPRPLFRSKPNLGGIY